MDASDNVRTRSVIGVFYSVYNTLGYGFVESIYSKAMEIQLVAAGHQVAREAAIGVRYFGQVLGNFRADLIVDDRLILELKAGSRVTEADVFQLVNYLRGTSLPLGLLLHFGPRPLVRRVEVPSPQE